MMRSLHKFLLLHVVAHLVQNALGNEIVNGELVPKDKMLYVVSLQTSKGHHECGGSLISKDFVLTAAHCKSLHQVIIGTHDLKETNRIVKTIDKKCIISNYSSPGYGNDLMLLKLSSEVKLGGNVQLAPLFQPGMNINDGQECKVAGWGKTSSGGTAVDQLRQVDVSVISHEECKKNWRDLSEDAICAGGYKTSHGFCQMDSGGPLVFNGRLVGVVSYNHKAECNYPNLPNVYVNIGKHLDWINGILESKTC